MGSAVEICAWALPLRTVALRGMVGRGLISPHVSGSLSSKCPIHSSDEAAETCAGCCQEEQTLVSSDNPQLDSVL